MTTLPWPAPEFEGIPFLRIFIHSAKGMASVQAKAPRLPPLPSFLPTPPIQSTLQLCSCAETRDRTGDLQIFSLTLSQLSYRGFCRAISMCNYRTLRWLCLLARAKQTERGGQRKSTHDQGCELACEDWNLRLVPSGCCEIHLLADGHTVSNAPDLIRPPKLSGTGPG